MTAAGSFTARGGGTVMKILIAEDSATIRRLVAAWLTAEGYDVVEAADGEEAVEFALREDPRTKAMPIVMLTERTSEDDVLGGLSLGVEEYIPKPFSPHELSARVRRALARPRP